MLMDSFEVENFRSLKHLKLEKLARVNLLVGKNNSGKTSVLEAINTLSAIEFGNWAIRFDRDIGPEKADLRYFFYNFDDRERINLKASYANPDAPFQDDNPTWRVEIFTREISRHRNTEAVGKERKLLRQSAADSVFATLYISPNSTPFTFSIAIDSQEKEMIVEPLNAAAKDFLKDGAEFPAYLRTIVQTVATHDRLGGLNSELEEMKLAKREGEVVTALQLIDPRITSLDIVGGEIYLDLGSQFRMLMPVNLMGDGVQRLLLIATLMAQRSGGIVLIDEIDNGLHYSALRILWRGILQAARDYDVQVFATTHSAEALRHLTWVLDDDCKDYRDDVAAYTLIRADDDTVRSYRHDYGQLEYALEHGIEVRN